MRALSKLLFFFGVADLFMSYWVIGFFSSETSPVSKDSYPYQTVGVLILFVALVATGFVSICTALTRDTATRS